MGYTYTPTYNSFQGTINSFCKSILPFKNRRLPAANQTLAKRHANNLKWQQDSFHRILNLIGLRNEEIVPEAELSAFRIHLLDTLIASPPVPEPPTLLRDKLLFLKELLYAKCISSEEYHSSKRPLLQRMAAQGAEIDCRDVIVGAQPKQKKAEEQWSDIDLNDEVPLTTLGKDKEKGPLKFLWRGKARKEGSNSKKDKEGSREDSSSILMQPTSPLATAVKPERANKRKPFRALFQKEQLNEEHENKVPVDDNSEGAVKPSSNKQWGFDGFKKWNRGENKSTKPYLPPGERSDDASAKPCDSFYSDYKVLGENIKEELSRIQSELIAKDQNMNFLGDQMVEAICKELPEDEADLNIFFPKPGDNVLNFVKQEFEDHDKVEHQHSNASKVGEDGFDGTWVGFEDEKENLQCSHFSEVWNQQGQQDAEAASDSYVTSSEAQNQCWNPKWDG